MLRTFSTTLSSSGKKLSSAYRGDWFGTTDASGISRWWRVLPQDGCAPGSSHRSACVQDVCKNQQTWGLPLGCIRVGDSYYDFVGCLTVLALGNPMLASPKNSLAASCCTVRFDPQALWVCALLRYLQQVAATLPESQFAASHQAQATHGSQEGRQPQWPLTSDDSQK